MKSEKDKIEKVFSSKLKDFEVDLPSSIWEKIDADLDIENPLIIPIDKKKRLYRYISLGTSVAAVILALVLLNIKLSDERDSLSEMQQVLVNTSLSIFRVEPKYGAEINTKIQKKQTLYAQQVIHSKSIKKSAKPSGGSPCLQNIVVKSKSLAEASSISHRDVSRNIEPDSVSSLNENSLIVEQKISVGLDNSSIENVSGIAKDDLVKKILILESDGDINKNLLAYDSSVGTSNRKSNESSNQSNIEMMLGGGTGFSRANVTQVQLRQSILSSLNNNDDAPKARKQTIHLEHNEPISFGVAFNKKLNNRFSLESGLIYTYLYSKAKSASDSRLKLRDSQSFHYLGIPLSINYNFLEWKKFQFYFATGGVIQKDIAGRMSTVQSLNGPENSKELIRKNISQSRPQLSLTGSVGLSYPIYNRLSLYSNFGGAYYFDANNYYETIYSDRKLIFNLNIGVKFGF